MYKKLGFEKEFVVARIVFTPFDQVETDESNGKQQANGKQHQNGEDCENAKDHQNGNHVNGETGYKGVNNNHKV